MLNSLGVLLQGLPAAPAQRAHTATRGPAADPVIYERNLEFIQDHVLPPGWRMNAVQVGWRRRRQRPALYRRDADTIIPSTSPSQLRHSQCRSGMHMGTAYVSLPQQQRLRASAASLSYTTGKRGLPHTLVGRRWVTATLAAGRGGTSTQPGFRSCLCTLRYPYVAMSGRGTNSAVGEAPAASQRLLRIKPAEYGEALEAARAGWGVEASTAGLQAGPPFCCIA